MFKVKFKNIDDVKNFVTIADRYESSIDVHLGRYNCDGRSLMGILGLDLMHVLDVEVIETVPGEKEDFLNKIRELNIVQE